MVIHKLSQHKIETAGPGKYGDGAGLQLRVSTKGSKTWVLRYRLFDRYREMGLGTLYDVSLDEAREKAKKYRKWVLNDIDPMEERKRLRREAKEKAQQESAPDPTFTTWAARYIRAHRRSWTNPKHGRQWVSTLKTYAKPIIGNKPVDQISTMDILNILKPIWYDKNETAKRIQGRIENILNYAAAHDYSNTQNPARWKGLLDNLLPKPSRINTIRHHPAMPYSEVSEFMAELSKKNSTSSLALQFLILNVSRTNEVLQARLKEIDLRSSMWTIPANRMKTRHEHRIPLSHAAMHILVRSGAAAAARIARNRDAYIFPGAREGRPLSNMALLQLMRKMGYGVNGNRGDYVPHGFRSAFRDWAGEVSSFPHHVAEMALAHTIQNKSEAAYRRGDLFDKRREMMTAWAEYIAA
ncbi:MAG: integrase arm-type DNA-binding domain-containing protein [Candidatus Thiodiazotropha sp.]|nr:integrase arm-type DNA-binding domain-containing protein [Candidatus Thiodiazotropha sp.]MCM8884571.1 integrase arm-type DNA-binding domain-containing protein [Candidatus Thiodiazotropha sp.]MCM8921389.1 integrase arm-type DNA-binding domain-containing protein [Candidatus Thiodiazotropha sp.]